MLHFNCVLFCFPLIVFREAEADGLLNFDN